MRKLIYSILAICFVVIVFTPMRANAESVAESDFLRDEWGNIQLQSFADLKRFSSTDEDSAIYIGEGPLVIEEDIVLEKVLDVHSGTVVVPAGITLTIADDRLDVGELVVEGTLRLNYYGSLTVYECLEVNGSLTLQKGFLLVGNADLAGIENITYEAPDIYFRWSHTAYSLSEVKEVISFASEYNHPRCEHTLYIPCDLMIDESLRIPSNVNVHFGDFMEDDGVVQTLTISDGCTVEANGSFRSSWYPESSDKLVVDGILICNGECSTFGPVEVNGAIAYNHTPKDYGYIVSSIQGEMTVNGMLVCNGMVSVDCDVTVNGLLENNGCLSLIYDRGGWITFADNVAYWGRGDVEVESKELDMPDAAVPWLDMSAYMIQKTYAGWLLSYKIEECTEHSYGNWTVVTAATCTENGVEKRACTVCGVTEEREISATGHSWDEGKITTEPTEDAEGEKTFTCGSCGETRTETIAKLDHVHKYTEAVTAPTCTEGGYTTYTCACGDSYQDNATSALDHSFAEGTCAVCGAVDPDWVEPLEESVRLAGGHRYETAFLAADRMKVTLGVDKFDAVVVASGTNFADALSGSYLAAVMNAPILLASGVDWVDALVKDYIKENLNSGGTVYILGGTSAVPAAFETGLDGFNVKRLAGGDRFDTNLKVLSEAGTGDKPILVCTGLSFADSLSASAAELPILLVWNKLTDDQKAIVEALARNGNDFIIIGGESAVSKDMENQIAAYGVAVERVAGGNRFETSVAIAERFFDAPEAAVLAYAWNFPDGLCGGALAATMDAPLILTMDKYEAKAAAYIRENAIQNGVILGGTGLISDKTVETIFE